MKNDWPKTKYGGLISYKDGRINPLNLLNALQNNLEKLEVKRIQKNSLSSIRCDIWN